MAFPKARNNVVASSATTVSPPSDFLNLWASWFTEPLCVSSSAYESFQSDQLQEEISAIARLRQNWDGYGAIPVSNNARQNTMAFVNSTAFANMNFGSPQVAPNPNGTMSVEWENAEGEAYVEFGDALASAFIKRTDGRPVYMHGNAAEIIALMPVLIQTYLTEADPNSIEPSTALVYSGYPDESNSRRR
jgi:hypothetical protein